MAVYFVAPSATGSNNGSSWANAFTSFASAIAAATTDGDIIVHKYNDPTILTSNNTTYTFQANIAVISADGSGTSYTPTLMDGDTGYIGHSSTGYSIILAGAFKVFFYGICLRTSANANVFPTIGTTDGTHYEFIECYIKHGATGSGANILLGATANASNTFLKFIGGKIGTARSANNSFRLFATCEFIGAQFIPEGANTTFGGFDVGGVSANRPSILSGCDFSTFTTIDNIIGGTAGNGACKLNLDNCTFPSTINNYRAASANSNKSGSVLEMTNCAFGDVHFNYGYWDEFGEVTAVISPYFNDGAKYDGTNPVCWKIVTTANCSYYTPFVTPWIEAYHAGTSTITPRLEILRNDSTTAFNNDQVWGEFSAQATSGSVLPVFKNDARGLVASAAAQDNGAGLSNWTGESGTAWSGKVDSGSSVTPAEIGPLRARVCVGAPNTTVYVDPFIRF